MVTTAAATASATGGDVRDPGTAVTVHVARPTTITAVPDVVGVGGGPADGDIPDTARMSRTYGVLTRYVVRPETFEVPLASSGGRPPARAEGRTGRRIAIRRRWFALDERRAIVVIYVGEEPGPDGVVESIRPRHGTAKSGHRENSTLTPRQLQAPDCSDSSPFRSYFRQTDWTVQGYRTPTTDPEAPSNV